MNQFATVDTPLVSWTLPQRFNVWMWHKSADHELLAWNIYKWILIVAKTFIRPSDWLLRSLTTSMSGQLLLNQSSPTVETVLVSARLRNNGHCYSGGKFCSIERWLSWQRHRVRELCLGVAIALLIIPTSVYAVVRCVGCVAILSVIYLNLREITSRELKRWEVSGWEETGQHGQYFTKYMWRIFSHFFRRWQLQLQFIRSRSRTSLWNVYR